MKKQKIYDYLYELEISEKIQLHPKTAKVLMDLGFVKEVYHEEKLRIGTFNCIFHEITPSGEDYLLDYLREIGKDFKE